MAKKKKRKKEKATQSIFNWAHCASVSWSHLPASLVSCHSHPSNYFSIWGQMDRWKETQMDWQAGWICKMKHFVGVACTIKRPVASAGRNSFTDEMENKEEFKEVFSRLIHPAVYRQPRSTSPLQRVMNEFVVSWGGLSTDWVNVAHLGHKSKSDAGYTATCKGVVLGCTPPRPQIYGGHCTQSQRHTFTFAETPSSITMQHQGHPVFSDIWYLTE